MPEAAPVTSAVCPSSGRGPRPFFACSALTVLIHSPSLLAGWTRRPPWTMRESLEVIEVSRPPPADPDRSIAAACLRRHGHDSTVGTRDLRRPERGRAPRVALHQRHWRLRGRHGGGHADAALSRPARGGATPSARSHHARHAGPRVGGL